MRLLIDENVPTSVSDFFITKKHEVLYVREVLAAGTPDAVVAAMGNRLDCVLVTWDKDFEALVRRIPDGNKAKFRRLGRISFKCREPQGRRLLERYINHIEFHHAEAQKNSDFRMIIVIQESGIKSI